jgi:hypothetical protein
MGGSCLVNLATWEAEIRRIMVGSQAGQMFTRPYFENTKHKKQVGGVAQVVKYLPSKHDTLSSYPKSLMG